MNSTAVKPDCAASAKRSRKGTSLNSIVRLAANLGIELLSVVHGVGAPHMRNGAVACRPRCPRPRAAPVEGDGLSTRSETAKRGGLISIQQGGRDRGGHVGRVRGQVLELDHVVDLGAH